VALRGRSRAWAAVCAFALLTLLPFARGLVRGQSFFFRDLSGYFLPLRVFALDGLRQTELRFWNPLVHEGEPLSLAPIGYPVDLLQAGLPRIGGISLVLALHVPLAALAFVALARALGVDAPAAAGGALVYAWGGFCLSALNLYVYLCAMAWAPLLSLGLWRAARGGRRELALAGLLLALSLSTTGVEITLQAVLLGMLLCTLRSAPHGRVRWSRVAASLALGAGLAAATILYTAGLVAGSERERGFETEVVLAHSVHPLTFLQVLVAGFYGDTSDLAGRFWGQNFFPQGFPYILSLYLGPAALALAALGALRGDAPLRRRLLLLALAGAVVCLGRYAGLAALVEALPPLRMLRYPSKAFFSVHVALALLAALGLDALARTGARGWRALALAATVLALPLAASPWLPTFLPDLARWFAAGFFPPELSGADRATSLGLMLLDAAAGGTLALGVALVAALVLGGLLRPRLATVCVTLLLGADLLRAGAGLNAMVDDSFFRLSAEMEGWAARFRAQRARVFTCEPEFQSLFRAARQNLQGARDAWTFAAYAEAFVPLHNMPAGVETALSRDRTMLVPQEQTLSARQVSCDDFASLVDPLRRGGVSHVLSIRPLQSPALRLLDAPAPARIAPLRVHIYALAGALPLRNVARSVRRAADSRQAEMFAREPGFQEAGGVAVEGDVPESDGASGTIVRETDGTQSLAFEVESDRASLLVVRDFFAPGWKASVDGAPAPVLRADGRHRAVPIPAGRSHVALTYSPPGMRTGFILSLLSMAVAVLLWRPWPARSPAKGVTTAAGAEAGRR
jgi:hypothetical protein